MDRARSMRKPWSEATRERENEVNERPSLWSKATQERENEVNEQLTTRSGVWERSDQQAARREAERVSCGAKRSMIRRRGLGS